MRASEALLGEITEFMPSFEDFHSEGSVISVESQFF